MKPLKFERHVESFIKTYQKSALNQELRRIGIGVSAGSDSVALLLVCCYLQTQYNNINFVVLHFNHQSRPKENEQEQNFVENLCLKYGLPFISKKNISPLQNETDWRKQRQIFFKETLLENQLSEIWLAHHLDDSFEWSLMQQAKSGNFQSTLGIPLKNGPIFRPFLCVTKEQIESYLKIKKQKFIFDTTNNNTNYERNWWRLHILKILKDRYPLILKHYAHRSFDLALKFNLIYLQTKPGTLIKINETTHLLYIPKGSKIHHSQNLIKNSLHYLSSKNRMKISSQLRSLINAYDNQKRGPIYFSGGVRAFLNKNTIVLTNDGNFNNEIVNDLPLQKILTTHKIIP